MFKNYFKTAIRNLWKHKTYTSINVFGLALAFICSILLFLNAKHELSFDQAYPGKERIYKMYQYYNSSIEGESYVSSMSFPMAPTLKAEITEIEASSRYFNVGEGVEYKGKKIEVGVDLVDNDFFKIFSIPIVKGTNKTLLNDLGNVVMSELAAKKIFNNEEPIGKLIKVKVYDQWKEFIVSAIIKNAEKNTSVTYDVLIRSELSPEYAEGKNNWHSLNHQVYIKIAANAKQEVIENKCRMMLNKYNVVDTAFMKNALVTKDAKGDYQSLRLLPLSEFHYNKVIGSGNVISKTYIYTILLISFFILAIACFNFINLNIARSFTRTKEIGIRKCLGATKQQVFMQVWGESMLVTLVAMVMGIAGSILLFPSFNKLFGSQLSLDFFYQPSTLFSMFVALLIISLFAGGYPAQVISKLNIISVLKGTASLKKPGLFRNALIIVQFTIACFLMACTFIAYQQFEFMRAMPLGFNKEAIISVPLTNTQQGRATLNTFRNRLASNPAILSVSGANINIGIGKDGGRSKSTTGFDYNGKSVSSNWMTADYDFLKTMGIKLIKGRNFSRDFATDSISGVLITESVAKQFEEKEIIGLSFSTDSAQPNYTVLGVIADFHLYSLHEKIEPLTIDISNYTTIRYLFIKTTTTNLSQSMAIVEKLYKECEPGKEFKGSFLDENTSNWYKKEKQLSLLLAISTSIAITLSCLGLFALALLMIQQRIKEIGIRKVLGASVFSINNLLAKDFLLLVIISIVLASPLAWYTMNTWLQDFPYKTEITIWIFITIGVVAVLISMLTISYQTIKAATANPVKSLRIN